MTNKIVDLTLSGIVDLHVKDEYLTRHYNVSYSDALLSTISPNPTVECVNASNRYQPLPFPLIDVNVDIHCCLCDRFIYRETVKNVSEEIASAVQEYVMFNLYHEICDSCRENMESEYNLTQDIRSKISLEEFIRVKTSSLLMERKNGNANISD